MVRLPVLVITALAASISIAAQQATVFRGGTETVSVFATVTDRQGQLIPDLTADDFIVLDDGRPQPLTVFNAGIQPVSIVLMLDRSGSMVEAIRRARAGAVQLFTRLLPADQARVGTITDFAKLVTKFTNDVDTLIRGLWSDADTSGGTALWEGLNLGMNALSVTSGRRVLMVLSDGYDTSPRIERGMTVNRFNRTLVSPVDELIARTQQDNVMIYAVGVKAFAQGRFGGPPILLDPHPSLRQVALASGGWYFELLPDDDLGVKFARVAEELHRQYELGYSTPARDGKLHRIDVRLKKEGLTARARPNYIAPSREP